MSEFSYDTEWAGSDGARALSLSLPINLDGLPLSGPRVNAYFDNLLPDSEALRRRIQSRFGTRGGAAFDLLAAIGRDCVGALQLLPENEEPSDVFSIRSRSLNPAKIEETLNAVSRPGVAGLDADDDFRISLAGAQEKTALLYHRGRWCAPRGSTPTTHIFKLPLGVIGNRALDMTHSLENEWLCAKILCAFSVPMADCELARFGEMQTLIVTRFDRRLHSSRKYWLRLPQEDFCQATGTPGSLKYEADGGPSLLDIARVLHASEERERDLKTLFRAQLLFWMLAATDGHAKNFSIHLLAGGRFRLTPLYDVRSAWPIAGSGQNQLHQSKLKLAMALRGSKKHYRIAEIRRRHFDAVGNELGLGRETNTLIAEIVERTPRVLDEVSAALPRGFPEHVFASISSGLRSSAEKLAAQR